MIRLSTLKILLVSLVLVLLLFGCSGTSSSSMEESRGPIVTGDLELPPPSESEAGTAVSEGSSTAPSSEGPSSNEIQVTPPKTTDSGASMDLTKTEQTALGEFINRSVAAFSSFEAADEIDDILVISGMVLCTQEGKSRILDDGSYGVEADVFEQVVFDYFGRHIVYPQVYEGETGEVQYDGSFYRWYGGGFEPGEWVVQGAEDLRNGYIKCNVSGRIENEEGEEVEATGCCILQKTSQSPFGYYFIASKTNE